MYRIALFVFFLFLYYVYDSYNKSINKWPCSIISRPGTESDVYYCHVADRVGEVVQQHLRRVLRHVSFLGESHEPGAAVVT